MLHFDQKDGATTFSSYNFLYFKNGRTMTVSRHLKVIVIPKGKDINNIS